MTYYVPEISDKKYNKIEEALSYAHSWIVNNPNSGVYICNSTQIVGEVFFVSKGKVAYLENNKIRGKLVHPNGQLNGVYSTPNGMIHIIVSRSDVEIMHRVKQLEAML